MNGHYEYNSQFDKHLEDLEVWYRYEFAVGNRLKAAKIYKVFTRVLLRKYPKADPNNTTLIRVPPGQTIEQVLGLNKEVVG